MNGFSELQQILAAWPERDIPKKRWGDNSLDRLFAVLLDFRDNPNAASHGDIAGLVRHVLCRNYHLKANDSPAMLRVPTASGWPDKSLWETSGVEVVASGNDFELSVSKHWSAEWLSGSLEHPPLRASFLEEERRKTWPRSVRYPLDPALKDGLGIEFENYSSPGQRQAIHSAFLMKPGGTLIVNLPTGTGKSLVAWGPALLGP